jgi:hypothetical protein
VADLNGYKDFLKSPPQDWISSTKWPRSDPRYRPFTGPLSDASRRQAMIAVKGLFAYAAHTGYLRRDPAALVKHVKTVSASRITRYLTTDALNLALSTAAAREAGTPAAIRRRERDLFLLTAYIHTGARLNEIVSANMGAFYSEGNGRWWLDVLAKATSRAVCRCRRTCWRRSASIVWRTVCRHIRRAATTRRWYCRAVVRRASGSRTKRRPMRSKRFLPRRPAQRT